jgi:hypothetical protein
MTDQQWQHTADGRVSVRGPIHASPPLSSVSTSDVDSWCRIEVVWLDVLMRLVEIRLFATAAVRLNATWGATDSDATSNASDSRTRTSVRQTRPPAKEY